MKIGILADVHEDVGNLHKALAVLRAGAADRLIFLGDLCGRMTALEETVAALDDAGVVGVWGNHDLGL